MGVLDYFRPVSTLPAEKIRAFLNEKKAGEYNLVDVRQPQEYESGHLPGARLIPVAELEGRLKELDPGKPTIVYWAAGVRSRAAASILARGRFRDVVSMEGGIRAWKGLTARGAPEAGIAHFPAKSSPSELTALAWVLEKGTQKFYGEAASGLQDSGAAGLFRDLAAAEEKHKENLYRIHLGITGAADDPKFPESVLPASSERDYMEGGVEVGNALEWSRGKSPQEVVEFALALEVNAFDLYLKMEQRIMDPRAKKMFALIAEEEKKHLSRLQEHFIRLMIPA